MIIEATAADFAALMKNQAPRNLRLVCDSAIAPAEILQMLRDLADRIRAQFAPAAWLVIEDGEVVGLCSITRLPENGEIHLGYGIAPTRQGRGAAGRALAEILAWAKRDPRVTRVSAETGIENIPSQRVLQRNGFAEVGRRVDAEDGPVICWQASAMS